MHRFRAMGAWLRLQHERNINAFGVSKALVNLPLFAIILSYLKPEPILAILCLGRFMGHRRCNPVTEMNAMIIGPTLF